MQVCNSRTKETISRCLTPAPHAISLVAAINPLPNAYNDAMISLGRRPDLQHPGPAEPEQDVEDVAPEGVADAGHMSPALC